MDNLITVKVRSDLYGLQKVNIDQLCFCSKDNTIFHLKDISRKNKEGGWEQVQAIPKNIIHNVSTVSGDYLTELLGDNRYVKLQNAITFPTQIIYGDISIIGNITASGEVSAFAESAPTNWWDSMPYATTTTVGGIKVGANLTIDVNGVLNGDGGAGAALWGTIGGDLEDQTDINIALGLKANTIHNLVDTTNHPVTGLTNGYFLKALSTTTYGFTVHGLTYSDVGAAASGHNHTGIYESSGSIATAIANLVNSSPATLDTLNEIAIALGNDPNFATTIITSLGLKAPIASPTFTGTVSGINATMIGLNNVTNESKTTMFGSPIFTTSFGFATTGWRFVESGTSILFKYNNITKATLYSDGSISFVGEVTAFA